MMVSLVSLLVAAADMDLKTLDDCIRCKFSQLPFRPRTVTGAAVLIYDAPLFFAGG